MKIYTEQELEEKYKQLPEAIEEAIFSVNAKKALEEIGKKHKLQIDQLGILANETRLVMLGLTHPKNFINNLAERLELNREIAKNIAQEINQQIFYAIREELKKMHKISPIVSEFNQAKKFRIQDLRKEKPPTPPAIIEPAPIKLTVTEPPPITELPITELPAIKPPQPAEPTKELKIPTTPFEHKLKSEEAVRAPLEEIKIPAEQKPPDKKYPTGDPYRESLE